ncbi:extracellular solute-binding protein [Humibacillus xanthopallidus]|uniref:Extracellular solute-binding protein n=1 Tax=Humibacillus xanthopallidus TaxID=412689 RepID=A0A543HHS6_9MICO|nr:extracellular solute-binding protein [Humibacillus xanthopallidus]
MPPRAPPRACAGGSSDVVAQPGSTAAGADATSTVNLYAYAVPKVALDALIPAFQKTDAGKGVQFQQSYGASGDQSRKVAAGAEADFVNFSVEPHVTRLVDAGDVDANWKAAFRCPTVVAAIVSCPSRLPTWSTAANVCVRLCTSAPTTTMVVASFT